MPRAVRAELPRPGFLVLLDNFYPGWRAFVAGREVTIQRANYTFRGVALPAGEATVEFVYQSTTFRAGLLVAFIALVGLSLVAVRDAPIGDRQRRATLSP